MNILIIEDEQPAIDKLIGLLRVVAPHDRIAGTAMSVRESVQWCQSHDMPDLILMDISLTDGSSFDIFSQTPITCPVIFITAHDEYWQNAFEHNGIDYLLKPVKKEKLAAALLRYEQLKKHFRTHLATLLEETKQGTPGIKTRFLVKRGTEWLSVRTEDIAYFYAADKIVFLVDQSGRRLVMDQSLTELEKQLDPQGFHRVNRKYLVQKNAIVRARAYSKSKLLLDVEPPSPEDIIVSAEHISHFKLWFGS